MFSVLTLTKITKKILVTASLLFALTLLTVNTQTNVEGLAQANSQQRPAEQVSKTVRRIHECEPPPDPKAFYTCRVESREIDNIEAGTTTARGATIVFAGNKVVAMRDCGNTLSDNVTTNTGYTDPNCRDFLMRKLSIGDEFTPDKKRELQPGFGTPSDDIVPLSDAQQGGWFAQCESKSQIVDNRYKFYKCHGETYVQDTVTQNVRYKPDTNFDTAGAGNLSDIDRGILQTPSGENIRNANLTPEQVTNLQNAYIVKAQAESTGEIKCENPLIKDGKTIFVCKRGDKLVTPTGREITGNNCAGVSVNSGSIQIGNPNLQFDQQCIATAQLNAAKSDTINSQLTKSTQQTREEVKENIAGSGNLLNTLGSVMVVIMFYLIYIFGWIGSILLWWLGIIFINILAINPASPDFIGAALRPWQILTGLANLLILATFIMVGFGYILNVKSLKRNIQEFLLQISIFALLLNFTLLGSAVVVNLAQGIGDVMIYTTVGANNGRPNRELLIDGFIRGLNRISFVRCGVYRESKELLAQEPDMCKNSPEALRRSRERGALSTAVDQAGDFGQGIANFNSQGGGNIAGVLADAGVQSNVLRMTLLESLFLFVVVYALIQLWNGLSLVMFRLIGLWLLMVTSPVALALYFLPVKSLSKYAGEWMDKFWRSTFFYPFFVLALVLHMRLVEALSLAVYQPGFLPEGVQINSSGGATQSSGSSAFGASIEVYANTDQQQIWRTAIITLISGSILAFIAIGTFSLIIKFFRDTFGALVSAVAKTVGTAWNAFRGATYLAGGVAKGVGAGAGSLLGAAGAKLDNAKWANRWAGQGGIKGFVGGGVKKIGGGFKNSGVAAKWLGARTDDLITAPVAGVDTAMWVAKETWDSFKKNNKARVLDKRLQTANALEYGLRKTGASDLMSRLGYDIDSNKALNTLTGTTRDEMMREEAQNKNTYFNQFRDVREKQVQEAQGLPDKFRNRDQASARLKTISDKLEKNGGSIAGLSTKERQDFARIVSRADDDATLAQELYTNKAAVSAVTQAYQQNILDQKGIQSLQNKFIHALPENELVEAAQNLDDIDSEKVPNYVFNDGRVFDAASRSRMSQEKLKQKLASNAVSQYTLRETQREVDRALGGESKDALVVQATTQGLRELSSQRIDAAGETILRTISDADIAGKSKAELVQLAADRYRHQASAQQFGIQLVAGDDAETIAKKLQVLANDPDPAKGWELLENTDASRAAIRGMSNWSSLTDAQKKETLVRVNANAAAAVQENFDSYMARIGDGLSRHAEGKLAAQSSTVAARNAYKVVENLVSQAARGSLNDLNSIGNEDKKSIGASAYADRLGVLSASYDFFPGLQNLYEGDSIERRRQIQEKMSKAIAFYQQNVGNANRFSEIQAVVNEINARRGPGGAQITFDSAAETALEGEMLSKGTKTIDRAKAYIGAGGNIQSALENILKTQESSIKDTGQKKYEEVTSPALVDLKGNYRQTTAV